MKDFMKKVYCYDHKPVTEIVETDSDSDGFHIEITESAVWRKVKTAKWWLLAKTMILTKREKRRKRKLPLEMTVMTPSKRACQH